jgi:malate dehydrogenase (oxaloacetate-decarboxylating)(NADP+)
MTQRQSALDYHELPTPGKLSIVSTKPCETAYDLSLAYSPGVAEPCLEIAKNDDDVYRYTAKGNLVAVISNGTAVLGLGDIGPHAAKPVMEGKAVLFKTMADVDVFDLELDCKDVAQFVQTVKALAPTFGGINLEDIKAPECFEIENQLKKMLDIPVFHDDQHGTAIIAGAAFLNAVEISGRSMKDTRVVFSGAGAAAIACAKLLISLGLPRENIIICDTVGVVYHGRKEGMNSYKEEFAVKTSARTLEDALVGADAFFGLSKKGMMTPKMLSSMAKNPIVFAMANPDPEIDYFLAKSTRDDVIMATGRSDCPNQVNNVLGFPFIFRGALDVRAKAINEEMKLAAVHALAALAKEAVPESVRRAYGNRDFTFGTEYIIPKPFDPRVLYYVAPAVARAAIDSGVARRKIDLEEYTLQLKAKQNVGRQILRSAYIQARRAEKKRIGFPEATNPRVLKAAIQAFQEGVAEPVLIGRIPDIQDEARRLEIDIQWLEIIEPESDPRFERCVDHFYTKRNRHGVTLPDARRLVAGAHIFAHNLLSLGELEGVICGVDRHYSSTVRPILEIIGLEEGEKTAAGLYLLSIKNELFFFADTTINVEMTSEKLAEVALQTARFAESLDVVPKVAFLSHSNFGSTGSSASKIVQNAVEIAKSKCPNLMLDGEMQVDVALEPSYVEETFSFSNLRERANVLIFPDMQAGNIAYKLLQRLGGARVVGPVILGLKKPAYVMQRHASVDEIFNMITLVSAVASRKCQK